VKIEARPKLSRNLC